MSAVTGPISTLPGHLCTPPDGAMCDDHPDVAAARRLQGETDSFGSEQHDLCQACVDRVLTESRADRAGVCDWCKAQADNLRPRRDTDEGSTGPVYRVCGACVDKENAAARAEREDSSDDSIDWDEDD